MKDFLKKNKVPTEQKMALAENIADGLAYLHNRNFLHRDIAA